MTFKPGGSPPHSGDNGIWLTDEEAREYIAALKRKLNGDPEPDQEGGNDGR